MCIESGQSSFKTGYFNGSQFQVSAIVHVTYVHNSVNMYITDCKPIMHCSMSTSLNSMGSLEYSGCLGSSPMLSRWTTAVQWLSEWSVLTALRSVSASDVTLLLVDLPECTNHPIINSRLRFTGCWRHCMQAPSLLHLSHFTQNTCELLICTCVISVHRLRTVQGFALKKCWLFSYQNRIYVFMLWLIISVCLFWEDLVLV